MKFPAPSNLRQTFQLFSVYRPEVGISSVIDVVDWTGVTPVQIYAALLGRLPENREIAVRDSDYNPIDHFIETIDSDEFQDKFIENFVQAFSEKSRLLFVHIPKCAGMDLEFDLGQKYPSLQQALTVERMTCKHHLHQTIAALAKEVQLSKAIFINGHIPLKWYIDHNIYRFGDKIFAIVRDPVDLVISWVNYIMTVLLADKDQTRIDTIGWLSTLGEASIPATISADECLALCRRILHNTAMIDPNYLCSYLGQGTTESVLDPLAISDVEIVDISRYIPWRRARWGLPEGFHINQSSRILTLDNITLNDRELLMEITAEDRRLYGTISEMMRETEAPSIRGIELVRRLTQS
jgi:hypothetical protein